MLYFESAYFFLHSKAREKRTITLNQLDEWNTLSFELMQLVYYWQLEQQTLDFWFSSNFVELLWQLTHEQPMPMVIFSPSVLEIWMDYSKLKKTIFINIPLSCSSERRKYDWLVDWYNWYLLSLLLHARFWLSFVSRWSMRRSLPANNRRRSKFLRCSKIFVMCDNVRVDKIWL